MGGLEEVHQNYYALSIKSNEDESKGCHLVQRKDVKRKGARKRLWRAPLRFTSHHSHLFNRLFGFVPCFDGMQDRLNDLIFGDGADDFAAPE